MVDFGGWDMPVQYSGIIDEHNAVRNAVGLFDVSHMGEIEIRGPEALKLIDYVTTNDAAKLQIGQAHYSGLLYEHGGFVDDILVHKVADDHFFLCVNASNQEKDFEHISRLPTSSTRRSSSRSDALCADRDPGPEGAGDAAEADAHADWPTSTTTGSPTARSPACRRASRAPATRAKTDSRSTLRPTSASAIWDELLDAGAEFGIKPCGLGARNTLRLEAKMALYGHEIDAVHHAA